VVVGAACTRQVHQRTGPQHHSPEKSHHRRSLVKATPRRFLTGDLGPSDDAWWSMATNGGEPCGTAPAPAKLPSSTRSDPALVAPALGDDGLTILLALQELGHESRDLDGPLQGE
jgi:hypothetical protein